MGNQLCVKQRSCALAETQTALRVVTHRAESALLALQKAEMVLDRLANRKEAAELVDWCPAVLQHSWELPE